MTKVITLDLQEDAMAFADRQVKEGRYPSLSRVVEDALRLLGERERKIEALRAAIIEGEESGEPEPFDFDEFIAECRAETQD